MQRQYSILRLNRHSDRSWAVIESPSGRIAVDDSGNLFMKMTKSEAIELARVLADGPPRIRHAQATKPIAAHRIW